MKSTFIVNFVGTATPATIKQLAASTHDNGGTWLVSKINFIDNQVAAVIKIELPQTQVEAVRRAFETQPNLLVQFANTAPQPEEQDLVSQLRCQAIDRPGIVSEITELLKQHQVHILDMDCQRVFIADDHGVASNSFTANLALRFSPHTSVEAISQELEYIGIETKVIIQS